MSSSERFGLGATPSAQAHTLTAYLRYVDHHEKLERDVPVPRHPHVQLSPRSKHAGICMASTFTSLNTYCSVHRSRAPRQLGMT